MLLPVAAGAEELTSPQGIFIEGGAADDARSVVVDEIELRGEHDSNGGYQNPNPGENWLQLRYMHWF